jgi:hypothetical protein
VQNDWGPFLSGVRWWCQIGRSGPGRHFYWPKPRLPPCTWQWVTFRRSDTVQLIQVRMHHMATLAHGANMQATPKEWWWLAQFNNWELLDFRNDLPYANLINNFDTNIYNNFWHASLMLIPIGFHLSNLKIEKIFLHTVFPRSYYISEHMQLCTLQHKSAGERDKEREKYECKWSSLTELACLPAMLCLVVPYYWHTHTQKHQHLTQHYDITAISSRHKQYLTDRLIIVRHLDESQLWPTGLVELAQTNN